MSNIIHVRLPKELLKKIDVQVKQLRAEGIDEELASRSGVVRTLLAQALGVDSSTAIHGEVLSRVYAVLQATARDVLERIKADLPVFETADGGPAGVSGARRKRR